ncbi:MAG TPA: ABC transporter ATP-binding protein/permease [Verrucomicrobiales bacterium]|jgi:putative ATP-binding cassette transporter|nr:ABC transporter ATP-binding protein/permease [Verrucomicrobiales bacterium]
MPDNPDETPARSSARQLGTLLRAFFMSGVRRRAWLWLGVLLLFLFVNTRVLVEMNYAQGSFFTALGNRDEGLYWNKILRWMILFVVSIPLVALYRYSEERLGLLWREWMTRHLLQRYFYNRVYYRLNGSDRVDNPDQRMTEDVKLFATTTLSLLLITLQSLVQVVAFIGVVWAITPNLLTALLLYAALGTFCAWIIGRRLVSLNYSQFQKEADFRYSLIRVRDHAESIAFYRGEKRERGQLRGRFAAVVDNTLRIIGWNRNLTFFITGYNYFALAVPVLIVAPLYFHGKAELGVITQAQSAFATVLAAFSLIITQFERISTYSAGIKRLGDLWDHLDEFDAEDERDAEDSELEVNEDARSLALEGLTVRTPDRARQLVRDLSFRLRPGESALLMGESGSGKSSLLRTIAGLWQSGSGTINRPGLNRLMFLPQRPYMIMGTLRDQLLYPQFNSNLSDDAIKDALEKANLPDVLDRVDGNLEQTADWANMLSLGEQQRVSFARLFLKKPIIAFLDEATSALDEPNEKDLYSKLRAAKMSYLSVGHRTTLKEFHDWLIVLKRDGSYTVERCQVSQPVKKSERKAEPVF